MAAFAERPPNMYTTDGIGGILGNSSIGPYQLPSLASLGAIPNSGDGQRMAQLYEMFLPSANAGLQQIPGLLSGAGPEGYNERIGQILGMDSTKQIVGEQQRELGQALATQGMRRSGYGARASADIPQQVAQSIEGLLTGRSQSLYGIGEGAAGEIGGALGNFQDALDTDKAAADQRSAKRRSQNAQIAGLAIALLSDERLKTNIEYGEKLPSGIRRATWVWNDLAGRLFGLFGSSSGVIAQEAEEIVPDSVIVRPDGFLMVNYGRVYG